MEELNDLTELVSLTEKQWTRRVFKKTKFTKAGIAGTRKHRILLRCPGDEEPRDDHVLVGLAQR